MGKSKYRSVIDKLEKDLSGLSDYSADKPKREAEQNALLLEAREKLIGLNLTYEQLIDECARMTVTVNLERMRFGEYVRREKLLLRPALDTAATMADAYFKQQSAAGVSRGRQQSGDSKKRDQINLKSGESGTASEIIKKLALKTDHIGDYLSSSELWPELFSELEDEGLKPQETSDVDNSKTMISHSGGKITFLSFKAMLSKARKLTKT